MFLTYSRFAVVNRGHLLGEAQFDEETGQASGWIAGRFELRNAGPRCNHFMCISTEAGEVILYRANPSTWTFAKGYDGAVDFHLMGWSAYEELQKALPRISRIAEAAAEDEQA